MGGVQTNIANNALDNIVKSGIDSAVTFAINCSNNLKSTQSITITGGCKFNAESIDFRNAALGITRCLADVSNQENIQNNVEQAVRQATEAAKQQLGVLNLGQIGINVATNTTKFETDLAETIRASFTTTCGANLENNQNITCSGPGSEFNLKGALTFNNFQTSIVDCTLKAVRGSEAYNNLRQVFEQSAVAKEENIFSIYVVVGLVSIAIIAIIIVNMKGTSGYSLGANGTLQPRARGGAVTWIAVGIVIVIGILLVLYAYMASTNGWWPFLANKPNPAAFRPI